MTAAGDAGVVDRDQNRPTLHPAFVQRALDAEAEAWAVETDIVDGWLARMSTDPRTVAKLRQIAVLAFTEGLYRGACNVFDRTPLAITVEQVATSRDQLAADLSAARAEVEALRTDKARLDFLDRCNARLNAQYGTAYRWRLVLNHNVNRLMLGYGDVDLHDSDGSNTALSSCREAIDDAIRAARTAGGTNGRS